MSSAPIVIAGNATRDPELRFMNNGNAKISFGVAFDHSWKDAQGEWQKETSFIDVIAWRQTAEDAAAVVSKGTPVLVAGRLAIRPYEDKEGNKRTATELVADVIALDTRGVESFVRKQRGNGDGQSSGGGQSSQGQRRRPPVDDSEPF